MIGLKGGSIGPLETGRRLPTKDRHELIVNVLHLNKSETARLNELWEAARAQVVPEPGPDPFTTMQSKLDEILAIVRRLDRGDRRGGGRHSVDPTPAETPRPALRRR